MRSPNFSNGGCSSAGNIDLDSVISSSSQPQRNSLTGRVLKTVDLVDCSAALKPSCTIKFLSFTFAIAVSIGIFGTTTVSKSDPSFISGRYLSTRFSYCPKREMRPKVSGIRIFWKAFQFMLSAVRQQLNIASQMNIFYARVVKTFPYLSCLYSSIRFIFILSVTESINNFSPIWRENLREKIYSR